MSAGNVNPPPQVRMPRDFFMNNEKRVYFSDLERILFQLWEKTGAGSSSTILLDTKLNITNISATQTISDYNTLYVVNASSAAINITLPTINSGDVGRQILICAVDTTNDITVYPDGSDTIIGQTSILTRIDYRTFCYTPINTSQWIIR